MTSASMRRRELLVLLASPMLLAQAAMPIFPPGSAIGMVPPRGFGPARNYVGFDSILPPATIRLMQLAVGTYADASKPDGVVSQGIEGFIATGREDAQAGGLPAVLLHGTQPAISVEHRTWLLIARPPGFTALVRVYQPDRTENKYSDEVLRSALATVAFRSLADAGDPLAELPFAVDDFAEFRLLVAGQTMLGMSALFTDGLLDHDLGELQPTLGIVWAPWPTYIPPEIRRNYARSPMGANHLRDPVWSDDETIVLPSGEWSVREAVGNDQLSGQSRFIMRAVLRVETGMLVALGECQAEARPTMALRFRRASLSARLR